MWKSRSFEWCETQIVFHLSCQSFPFLTRFFRPCARWPWKKEDLRTIPLSFHNAIRDKKCVHITHPWCRARTFWLVDRQWKNIWKCLGRNHFWTGNTSKVELVDLLLRQWKSILMSYRSAIMFISTNGIKFVELRMLLFVEQAGLHLNLFACQFPNCGKIYVC